MKPYTYALIAAAAACGLATAAETAYTTPVGYETLTLAPGQFNLIGVRLFGPSVAAGTFESSTSTSLTDDQAAFALNASTEYIVECQSGATVTTLGSSFSGTSISGLSGITAAFEGPYVIREAETVSSVFGANNEAGLAASANADPTEADMILIPDGAGFIRVFFSTYSEDPAFAGWLNADTFEQIPNEVISPSQGLFVQTANSAAPINLVVSGEVKTSPTAYAVDNAFTLLGSVYPAGATLATSNLSAYVQPSPNADPTEADNVLLPNGLGGFTRAFYSTYTEDPLFSGWLNSDTFAQIPNEPMTPGFFVQKVGPSFSGVNTPPSVYSSL